MTIPIWMLTGFAAWTVLLLLMTVGVYRWSRILTGRAPLSEFKADHVVGEDWYKRAMRAHANCIENLPVFGAIVFALYVSNTRGTAVDTIAVSILVARVCQSLTHVCFTQTNGIILLRFIFFFSQLIAFLALIVMIISHTGVLS